LIPDYSKDTSILAIKLHHSITDGMGLICTIGCFEDKFEKSKVLEQVPKLNFFL